MGWDKTKGGDIMIAALFFQLIQFRAVIFKKSAAGGNGLTGRIRGVFVPILIFLLFCPVSAYCSRPTIAAGGLHTVALEKNGTVRAWGNNDYGQLGGDNGIGACVPVQIPGPGGKGCLEGVKAVMAGEYHTVVLKTDGTVWAWGRNISGQLGNDTATDQWFPVQVKSLGGTGFLSGIKAVAAGGAHTVALKMDGTVWAWGNNEWGQLGNNTTDDQWTPVQVLGPGGVDVLSGVKAIAAGRGHTVALKDDGTVWAWGDNRYGSLGDMTATSRTTPVQVAGLEGMGFLSDIRAVAAGGEHTVVLKEDGTVCVWGRNHVGQLGLGDRTIVNACFPIRVPDPWIGGDLAGVRSIAAGYFHTVALKDDGTVWAWGWNENGQLGNDTDITAFAPIQVLGPGGAHILTGANTIAAGWAHTVVLKDDGTVWAWGWNRNGELGNNTTTDQWTPVRVLDMDLGNSSQAEVVSFSDSSRGGMDQDQITILSPNGGDIWDKGKTYSITWNTGSMNGYVAIAVYKNDAYAAAITTLTENDGSYGWTVPISLATGSDYKIKIRSLGDGSCDFSDGNFTIQGTPIRIVSPNGGEIWQKGSTYTITWDPAGIDGSVALALYRNGIYSITVHGSAPNTGSCLWTIPSNLTSAADYKIKIKSLSNGSSDFSDSDFTIEDSPDVTVTSLAGGYRLKGFTVIYDNGQKYCQDSISDYSGSMSIYSDGTMYQTVYLAGTTVYGSGKMNSIYNNNMGYLYASSCGNYWIGLSYSNNVLTTYMASGVCGNNYWEVEVWERTSSDMSDSEEGRHVIKNGMTDHCIGCAIQELVNGRRDD